MSDFVDDFLGTDAELSNARTATLATVLGYPTAPVTLMAKQSGFGNGFGRMEGQRHRATGAAYHVTAVAALDNRRTAAAIQEQDRLLALANSLDEALFQSPAEDATISFAQFLTHIADFGLGQLSCFKNVVRANAVGQFK